MKTYKAMPIVKPKQPELDEEEAMRREGEQERTPSPSPKHMPTTTAPRRQGRPNT